MKRVCKSLFLAVVLNLLLAGFASPSSATTVSTDSETAVLVLMPLQVNTLHYSLAAHAIQAEFNAATDFGTEIYFEFADLERFPGETYRENLVELYTLKYSQRPINLVIVATNRMLDFWLTHRTKILPDTPVVFYDVSPQEIQVRDVPDNVTGLISVFDHYVRTADWILQTRPDITEVVLVYGVGAADREEYEAVSALKERLEGQVQITDLSDLSLAEVKARVATLPNNAIVFYCLIFQDVTGEVYRPVDPLRELAALSSVPVVAGYDQLIGTGVIGGYVYSIEKQSAEAVRIGLRIINGEPVSSIPVTVNAANSFVFDHPALKRHGISLSTLPPESVIKNREYTLWELYQAQITGIIVAFVGLAAVATVLAGLNRRLTITRRALRALNTNLESQVEERTADLLRSNDALHNEIAERMQAETEREQVILELEDALAHVKQLEGILPVCSFCKKIRDEDDQWQPMEAYIRDHSQAEFSHGFCPECGRKHYPEFFGKKAAQ